MAGSGDDLAVVYENIVPRQAEDDGIEVVYEAIVPAPVVPPVVPGIPEDDGVQFLFERVVQPDPPLRAPSPLLVAPPVVNPPPAPRPALAPLPQVVAPAPVAPAVAPLVVPPLPPLVPAAIAPAVAPLAALLLPAPVAPPLPPRAPALIVQAVAPPPPAPAPIAPPIAPIVVPLVVPPLPVPAPAPVIEAVAPPPPPRAPTPHPIDRRAARITRSAARRAGLAVYPVAAPEPPQLRAVPVPALVVEPVAQAPPVALIAPDSVNSGALKRPAAEQEGPSRPVKLSSDELFEYFKKLSREDQNKLAKKQAKHVGKILKFECGVCMEKFGNDAGHEHCPRILGCGHTHCTTCLTDLLREGRVSCPECTRRTRVTDIKTLPINYIILQNQN